MPPEPVPPEPVPPKPVPPEPVPPEPVPPEPVETEVVDVSGAVAAHSRYISNSKTSGKIICRAQETGSHMIKFFEVGADLDEEMVVKSLENSIMDGENLLIDLKGEKTVLNVEFKREVLGGVKVLLRKA